MDYLLHHQSSALGAVLPRRPLGLHFSAAWAAAVRTERWCTTISQLQSKRYLEWRRLSYLSPVGMLWHAGSKVALFARITLLRLVRHEVRVAVARSLNILALPQCQMRKELLFPRPWILRELYFLGPREVECNIRVTMRAMSYASFRWRSSIGTVSVVILVVDGRGASTGCHVAHQAIRDCSGWWLKMAFPDHHPIACMAVFHQLRGRSHGKRGCFSLLAVLSILANQASRRCSRSELRQCAVPERASFFLRCVWCCTYG